MFVRDDDIDIMASRSDYPLLPIEVLDPLISDERGVTRPFVDDVWRKHILEVIPVFSINNCEQPVNEFLRRHTCFLNILYKIRHSLRLVFLA